MGLYPTQLGPYLAHLMPVGMSWSRSQACEGPELTCARVLSPQCKCAQYWPDQGCWTYGNIRVSVEDVTVLVDYTVRKFCIQQVPGLASPIPSDPIPSHPIPSYPIPSHPIPTPTSPSELLPSCAASPPTSHSALR